jgi:hypothetical protein
MCKMNIFFLSMSIRRCAKYHFDKHVIKMILEYCQLLSTAWHVLQPEQAQVYLHNKLIYKSTHINHPSTKWVREHINNYMYVVRLALQLCKEWRFRYKHERIHACEPKLHFLYNHLPNINSYNIDKTVKNPKCLTLPLPLAMPDVYKCKNPVKSYRNYYQSPEKSHLTNWKNCQKPYWFL